MRPVHFALLSLISCAGPEAPKTAPAPFGDAVADTRRLADEIVSEDLLPGLSAALVSGDELVWAEGFGLADREKRQAATPATVYRVGSISKLFTALAAMQLVEQGKLDLDRPLEEYLPGLGLQNPFRDEAGPVKPRQLSSHVSGLFRESPVGSYFDGSGATPAQALASVSGQRLVHPPGRVTKYSNIGVSLFGSLVERVSGMPYTEYEARYVLGPLAMTSSSFLRTPAIDGRVATGYMQERGGRLVAAPRFELATVAAGNLYSTVEDLAKLARMIHGRGELEGRRIVRAETFEQMSRPQFPAAGGRFGIGFALGERFGEKTVEHTGAVYGFSSVFVSIPRLRLSVILLANEDVAFGPLRRLTDRLLGGAVAAVRGEAPPSEITPVALDSGAFATAAGVYRSADARVELREEGGRAVIVWTGHPVRLVPTGRDAFITRDRLLDGNRVIIVRDGSGKAAAVRVDDKRFDRFDPASAPAAPAAWAAFEGEYGPDYLPVRVHVREGRLVVECETFEYEPDPGSDGSFVFPRGTLYEDEAARFQPGLDGKAAALTLGTMRFERRR